MGGSTSTENLSPERVEFETNKQKTVNAINKEIKRLKQEIKWLERRRQAELDITWENKGW